MKIVVIIPTYNEKVNMENMIPLLEKEVFPTIKNHEMEILVADDKSPDGTKDVVEKYMKAFKNIHLIEGSKQGLGAAYARAMRYAMDELKAEAVVEIDADFQHDPRDIPRLIEAMDKGADYVIGSRYIPGGKIPDQWQLYRKIMSSFGSLFARLVLLHSNVKDMTSGFKLTKSEFLRKVDLENLYSDYYAYKIHILHDVLLAKAKVKEVPIVFYERTEGSSKITQKDLIDSFLVVLKLRFRDSKRFVKFLIVGGTGFTVQILVQELSVALGIAMFIAVLIYPEVHHFFDLRSVIELKNIIAVALGAEFAILSNFMINNFWTFTDARKIKEKSHVTVRLMKFNITSLISIFLQVAAATLAIKTFGVYLNFYGIKIPTRIAFLIPTIVLLVIPLNYFIYNKIIWKTHHLSRHEKNLQ